MVAAAGFSSCEGDLERPPMVVPEATHEANTTIAELKSSVWQTSANYVTTVGTRDDNQHIYIAGRVVSSDASGNIFKSVVIQDATAALAIAINSYDLYQSYQQGQMVVVDVTDLKIGGYNGLLQLGGEGTYNGAPSMTFMDKDLFASHAEVSGLALIERIDTTLTTIPEVMTAKGSVEGLQKWQSRLVRIDGVSFVDAGQPFAGDSNANRYVTDAQGNRINVRNSSYADFARAILPSGSGSIVGILSYYGSDWQILLNDINGCIGFEGGVNPGTPDQPTPPATNEGDGTESAPYTVTDVIGGATGTGVWVKGYIVGSVTDKSYDSAQFAASPASQSNLLIAASPDETNANKCVPVQLPIGNVRNGLNLDANPGNYKAEVTVMGDLLAYFGKPGVKNVTAYTITGGSSVTPPEPGEGATFKAATAITSGKSYIIVAEGKVALPVSGNYGYLKVADVTVDGSTVVTDEANAFVFTSVSGGYTITQPDGRLVYMTGSYNSFNVAADASDGQVWTVDFTDGKAVITNVAMSKSIQYDPQYTSYGAYPDVRGTYPTLYEKVD